MTITQDMWIEEANNFIDNATSTTYVLLPENTMKLLWLVAYDNVRLQGLLSIVKNTITYCEAILSHDNSSHPDNEERSLAREIINKQKEIEIGIESLLN